MLEKLNLLGGTTDWWKTIWKTKYNDRYDGCCEWTNKVLGGGGGENWGGFGFFSNKKQVRNKTKDWNGNNDLLMDEIKG